MIGTTHMMSEWIVAAIWVYGKRVVDDWWKKGYSIGEEKGIGKRCEIKILIVRGQLKKGCERDAKTRYI